MDLHLDKLLKKVLIIKSNLLLGRVMTLKILIYCEKNY